MIFWWTGRGIYTLLVVVVTMAVCALALNVLRIGHLESRAFWGGVIAASAIPNWFLGVRLNAKKRVNIRGRRVRDRLLYRARHSFLSLPMETFSVVIVLIGTGIVASTLF